jgi:hypothetical protein
MKLKFLHLTFLICMMYAKAFSQITITAQKTISGSGVSQSSKGHVEHTYQQ